MSEFDALEKELAAIRPRQPSDGLKTRIADRLEASTRSSIQVAPRRVPIRVAIIGGLVAASLAVVVIWRGRVPRSGPDPQPMPAESLLAMPLDPDVPSVWSYRSALVHSPANLESLLDQHSHEGRTAESVAFNVHAFARLDSNLHDLEHLTE